MFQSSLISTFMNMTAEIYEQQNVQSESGTVQRKWQYSQTIPCKVMATQNTYGSSGKDSKDFSTGTSGYKEDIHVKMQSPVLLSKRWRVSVVKTNDGQSVFVEPDLIGDPDTIFEIISNHAVLDPFGKISYYEINLRRAAIQNNDTATV